MLRRFGRGAYGEVWLARSATGAYRAVKVVHRRAFDHDRPYEREFNGVKNFEPISRTSDSHVDILQVGRNDAEGWFYYVMELADDQERGRDIDPANYRPRTLRSDLYHQGRLPVAQCLEIGLQLAAALEVLHNHSLVHRDVKPSNILFVNDLPRLGDLNRLLRGALVYQPERFGGVALSAESQMLLARQREGNDTTQFNRLLLEDAYPQEMPRRPRSLGCLGDTDNDGKLELIAYARHTDTESTILILADDGSLLNRLSLSVSVTKQIEDDPTIPFATLDIDRDGRLEILGVVNTENYPDPQKKQGKRGLTVLKSLKGSLKWTANTGPFLGWRYNARVGVLDAIGQPRLLHGSAGPNNGRTGLDGSLDGVSYAYRYAPADGTLLWRRAFDGLDEPGFYDAIVLLPDLDGDGTVELVATFEVGEFPDYCDSLVILDRKLDRVLWEHGFDRKWIARVLVADLESDGSRQILLNCGGRLIVLRAAPSAMRLLPNCTPSGPTPTWR
jgi:hypothetical protein